MEQTIYIPAHESFDRIDTGEVRAFLLDGDERDAVEDKVRFKPFDHNFTEDDMRRLVRRGTLPLRVKVTYRTLTSIFALSTNQLKLLGQEDRLECLENFNKIYPRVDMKDPVTLFMFEPIK